MSAHEDHVTAISDAIQAVLKLQASVEDAIKEYRLHARPALFAAIGHGNDTTMAVWAFAAGATENLATAHSELGLINHDLSQYRDRIH